jgi:hypothetical protein
MSGPRSIPLILRRADARDLDVRIKEHRRDCAKCVPRMPCDELTQMRADLAAIRHELRTWFDPGDDQPALFGPEATP